MASREWVRFNEDSRASRNRAKHVEENGGHFERNRKNLGGNRGGWQWVAPVEEKKAPAKKPAAKKPAVKKKGV